ncbi:MAG: hypothetical protein ACT4OK_16305 [Gemmobacter sp.]
MPATTKRTREENPSRLAMLLTAIRKDLLHFTQEQMAEKLLEKVRPDGGEPSVEFSQAVVTAIENRKIGYRYAHLEAYARVVQVPVGILLLVSRYSQTDEPTTALKELISLLERFIDVAKQASKEGRSLKASDVRKLGGLVEHEVLLPAIDETVFAGAKSPLERLERARRELDRKDINPLDGLSLFRTTDG